MHSLVSCQPHHSSLSCCEDILYCLCLFLCASVIEWLHVYLHVCAHVCTSVWRVGVASPAHPCRLRAARQSAGGSLLFAAQWQAGNGWWNPLLELSWCCRHMSPSVSPFISPLTWGLMPASKPRSHPLPSSPGGPQPCQRGSKGESGGGQICQYCLSSPCIQHTHSLKAHTHKLT